MIIIDLIYNLAVLIALSVLSGFIDLRFNRTDLKGKILQGLLFGATAIIGMLNPFYLTAGIIFDGRSIVLSLCTLFFGPISGLIASVLAILFRIHIGGGGALTGILVITSSFLIGLFFNIRRNKSFEKKLTRLQLYIFGLIVNGIMLVLFLTLPYKDMVGLYKILTVTILGVYPFATLLIGKILLDQEENQNFVKKLKESEELFRTTLYSIGDAVITTDIQGRVRQMNSVAEKLTGWNETETNGKQLEEIFDITDEISKNRAESPIKRILKEDSTVALTNHTLLLSRNKKEIPIADSGAPIKNSSGETIGAVIVFRDQTEERAKQKVLKAREFWLRESQRVGRIGSYELNIKTNVWISSEVLDEIFGLDQNAEKTLMGWNSIVHPDHREELLNYFLQHVVAEKNLFDKVYRIIRVNDGEERWVWGRGELTFDDDGNPIQMIGTIQDITESKRAEEALHASEEKFRTIFETANEGICIVNKIDEITTVNNKFTEMVGYRDIEIKGKSFQILIPMEDLNEYINEQKNRNYYSRESYERRLRCKDGSIIWALVKVSHLLDEKKSFMGSFGMFTDITGRKKMEEDLLTAKEKAEESNKLKSNFLASMSHELRTPLVGILGFAEILEGNLGNQEQKAMATTVLTSGRRLLDTLTSLLNLSRIESGREKIEIVQSDANLIINELTNLFAGAARKSNLFIKTELENNFLLELDERFFRDTITNLLNNAIKFTKQGGITVRTFYEQYDGNDYGIVEVQDTGIGIPQDKINLIFEEFRQVSEGIGRNFEGSGLGLTLTKKYIELMNGKISVKTKLGEGTIFRISFPYRVDNSNRSISGIKKHKIITDPVRIENLSDVKLKQVLIVENDEVSRKFLLRCLKNIAICNLALDGDQAIKLAMEYKYDVIFMDINLGGRIDGIEATQEIRKISGYSDIPIIAVTAFAAEKDKLEFLSKGCTHYISKPYFMNDIVNLLNDIFNKKN